MEPKFILSCESTVDMPYSYVNSRNIPVLFYSYTVDDKVYPDDMGRDPNALPHFYEMLNEGKMPSTSQLNDFQYKDYFEELLKQGDVLHIAFGSGMTNSVQNAKEVAELMKKEFPDRKLIVIDSYCSSSGYGMLVDYAADMRDEGCDMETVRDWVEANAKRVHHQFYSTDLKYFRRSGRVSGPAAAIGAVLNICPIMRLDESGHIVAYDKVRGRKNAIQKTVDTMAEHAEGGEQYSGKCFISHSNCLASAEELKADVEARFPNLAGKIQIFDIGTIISSHCGPGTVAVYFLGDTRAPYVK